MSRHGGAHPTSQKHGVLTQFLDSILLHAMHDSTLFSASYGCWLLVTKLVKSVDLITENVSSS